MLKLSSILFLVCFSTAILQCNQGKDKAKHDVLKKEIHEVVVDSLKLKETISPYDSLLIHNIEKTVFKTKPNESYYESETTEGGSIGIYDVNNSQLIVFTLYGELGKIDVRFMYMKKQLKYIKQVDYQYNDFFYSDSLKITDSIIAIFKHPNVPEHLKEMGLFAQQKIDSITNN